MSARTAIPPEAWVQLSGRNLYLDMQHVLVGDSLLYYAPIRGALANGNQVTICTNPRTLMMLEFLCAHAAGWENARLGPPDEREPLYFLSGVYGYDLQECWLPSTSEFSLRCPLAPVVTDGNYTVFHASSVWGRKYSPALQGSPVARGGYSVGASGDVLVPGTLPFFGRSISEVARLITHARGMIAIHSCMALLASMLRIPKLVIVDYRVSGVRPGDLDRNPKPVESGAGQRDSYLLNFSPERCRILPADVSAEELRSSAESWIGGGVFI